MRTVGVHPQVLAEDRRSLRVPGIGRASQDEEDQLFGVTRPANRQATLGRDPDRLDLPTHGTDPDPGPLRPRDRRDGIHHESTVRSDPGLREHRFGAGDQLPGRALGVDGDDPLDGLVQVGELSVGIDLPGVLVGPDGRAGEQDGDGPGRESEAKKQASRTSRIVLRWARLHGSAPGEDGVPHGSP